MNQFKHNAQVKKDKATVQIWYAYYIGRFVLAIIGAGAIGFCTVKHVTNDDLRIAGAVLAALLFGFGVIDLFRALNDKD